MDPPVVIGEGSLFPSPESDHLVPVKKFYQSEPVALGITQIFIGTIGIVLGMLVNFADQDSTFFLETKIPYWGGILYIISGSLAVAAARNPKIPLVKGTVAMNAISAITAGLGIIFLSFSVGPTQPFRAGNICNDHRYDTKEKCDEVQNIGMGILVFLTVVTILEFCIAISLASFGCKMLCRDPFTETVVVVFQNEAPCTAKQHPRFDCSQPAIHS